MISEEILAHYRVLNDNGANDIICHYPGTEEMYANTVWPGSDMFLQSHRNHNTKRTRPALTCVILGRVTTFTTIGPTLTSWRASSRRGAI